MWDLFSMHNPLIRGDKKPFCVLHQHILWLAWGVELRAITWYSPVNALIRLAPQPDSLTEPLMGFLARVWFSAVKRQCKEEPHTLSLCSKTHTWSSFWSGTFRCTECRHSLECNLGCDLNGAHSILTRTSFNTLAFQIQCPFVQCKPNTVCLS